MAESKIKGGFEFFTPTLKNGASIPSWGHVQGIRVGNIGIVSLWGIEINHNPSIDTVIMDIPFMASMGFTGGLTGFNGAMCAIDVRQREIFVNTQMRTGSNYFGEVVFVITG